jgi:hypothetical protein
MSNMLQANRVNHYQKPETYFKMGFHKSLNDKQKSVYEVLCYESYRRSSVTHKMTNRDLALLAGIPETKVSATRKALVRVGLIQAKKLPLGHEYTLMNPATQQPLSNKRLTDSDDRITYDYMDDLDDISFQVVRYGNGYKKYLMQRPNPYGDGWIENADGCPELIYRLAEVKEAEIVFVTEGERDVEAIFRMRLRDDVDLPIAATCNPGGANNWKPPHAAFLKNKVVFICGDNDPSGRIHVDSVKESLRGIAEEVVIVNLPKEYNDVTEYMEMHITDDFLKLVGDERLQNEKVYL